MRQTNIKVTATNILKRKSLDIMPPKCDTLDEKMQQMSLLR